MPYAVRLDLPGMNAGALGDVHLGKRFLAGVPLHRRGEHEQMVRAAFASALDEAGAYEIFIQPGDIFDTFSISNGVLLWTEETIRAAARRHPNTLFILQAGNHDAVRDATLRSSFDVLAALLAREPNITVVRDQPYVTHGLAILPWSPFKTADEMATELVAANPGPLAGAIGHWDADSFGDNTSNLIPTQILSAVTHRLWSGHEHLARSFERDGVHCTYVGSMLPLAHGEDATGHTYVTITLDQAIAAAPEDLRNKCVRVLLPPGQSFNRELDCLQLQTLKVEAAIDPSQPIDVDVKFDDFDPEALFNATMIEHEVPAQIVATLRQRWAEAKDATAI